MPSVTKIVGTGANIVRAGSAQAWNNPSNITTDDSLKAETSDLQNLGYTDYCQGTMTGNLFAIGTDQQIDGVEIQIKWRVNGTDSGRSNVQQVFLVSSLGDGTDWGDGYQITKTPTTRTYGGPTDKGGLALTPAVVNAGSFGARASAVETLNGNGKRVQIFVMKITVYYSPKPARQRVIEVIG